LEKRCLSKCPDSMKETEEVEGKAGKAGKVGKVEIGNECSFPGSH
jgi:hypothetical protein